MDGDAEPTATAATSSSDPTVASGGSVAGLAAPSSSAVPSSAGQFRPKGAVGAVVGSDEEYDDEDQWVFALMDSITCEECAVCVVEPGCGEYVEALVDSGACENCAPFDLISQFPDVEPGPRLWTCAGEKMVTGGRHVLPVRLPNGDNAAPTYIAADT